MLGYRAKYRSKASQGLGRFVWERSISWVLEEVRQVVGNSQELSNPQVTIALCLMGEPVRTN